MAGSASGFSSGGVVEGGGGGGGGGAGALMQTRKREQSRGTGGTLPQGNFKFKSSEMAINASKTANSNINLQLLHRHLKKQVTTRPPR